MRRPALIKSVLSACAVLFIVSICQDVWIILRIYSSLETKIACEIPLENTIGKNGYLFQNVDMNVVFLPSKLCGEPKNTQVRIYNHREEDGFQGHLLGKLDHKELKQVFTIVPNFGAQKRGVIEHSDILKMSWLVGLFGPDEYNAAVASGDINKVHLEILKESSSMKVLAVSFERQNLKGSHNTNKNFVGTICAATPPTKAVISSVKFDKMLRGDHVLEAERLRKIEASHSELATICRLMHEPNWVPPSTLLPTYLSANWNLFSQEMNYPQNQTLLQSVLLHHDVFLIGAALKLKHLTV